MNTRLTDLPNEMLFEIVKNLDSADASEAAKTCLQLSAVVHDIWECRTDKHFPAVTTDAERQTIIDWPNHFRVIETRIYQALTARQKSAFYLLKEKRYSELTHLELTIIDFLATDANGDSLMTLASQKNDRHFLDALYKRAIQYFTAFGSIDPHRRDIKGQTLLHWAIYCRQSPDTISATLEHGLNCNLASTSGKTPLMIAVCTRQLDIATALLNRNADPHQTVRGNSPIITAVESNLPEMIHLLVSYGVSTLQTLTDGTLDQKQLCLAAKRGHIDALNALLSYEDINAVDGSSGKTALHVAAEHGQVYVINYLLTHGATINAIDDDESTPLHLAIRGGKNEAVLALLEHHADVHHKNRNGVTPLLLAVSHLDVNMVATLYEQHPDQSPDNRGATPLYAAAEKKKANMVEYLLSKGANIDQTSIDGRTALYVAVRNNDYQTADLLLRHCANPNIANIHGITPLYVAARMGNVELTRLLLKYHANTERETYGTHKTALMKALENGHTDVAIVIRRHRLGMSRFKKFYDQRKLEQDFTSSAIVVPRISISRAESHKLFKQAPQQEEINHHTDDDNRYVIDL